MDRRVGLMDGIEKKMQRLDGHGMSQRSVY